MVTFIRNAEIVGMDNVKSAYMDFVAGLGCIVDDCDSPACLHHPRGGFANGYRKSSDWLVIPLCPEHHQGGYSIHGSPELFKKIEGSEAELLARTIEKVFRKLKNEK